MTGISHGQVAYNDPTLGKQAISTEEFLRLPALPARPGWSLQGKSGVAVRREAPAGDSTGYAPWVAAGAALMALISQTPLALLRKGIGGRLDAGGAGAGRGPAPPGYRWVQRQTPKYEWREVQEGWDMVPKTVPKMVRRHVQVGWTTMTERIPRYETVRVQDGWTYTYERVPSYRTERYIRYWRTEYTNQATFRYVGGMRVFAGYKRVARRVPVYGTRRVFVGWQTQRKRVPRLVERTVIAGYDVFEKRVPKYGWVEEQDGWKTETVQIPNMVCKQVQVATEWRWVQEEAPIPPPPPPVELQTTPTPTDEEKLTHIEPQLDPIIPPEPTREELKLAQILLHEPVIGFDAGDEQGAQQLEGVNSPHMGATETPTPTVTPTSPYITPTQDAERDAAEAASATPSRTPSSTQTPTPTPTPHQQAFSPTDTPHPNGIARDLALVYQSLETLLDHYSPLPPEDVEGFLPYDPLEDLRHDPFFGRFAGIIQLILTRGGVIKDVLESEAMELIRSDPMYPLLEPVPRRPSEP